MRPYVEYLRPLWCCGLLIVTAGFTMRPLSIAELTRQADLVLLGTVQTQTCSKDAEGRVLTRVEFQITDCWKGHPASNPFPIVLSGGTLGDNRVVVSGQAELKSGETALLFLVRNSRGEGVIMGLSQGKFRVWKEADSGDTLAANIFFGRSHEANSVGSIGPLARLTLAELKRQVIEFAK